MLLTCVERRSKKLSEVLVAMNLSSFGYKKKRVNKLGCNFHLIFEVRAIGNKVEIIKKHSVKNYG